MCCKLIMESTFEITLLTTTIGFQLPIYIVGIKNRLVLTEPVPNGCNPRYTPNLEPRYIGENLA